MDEKEHPLLPLPEEAFRRYDETPDEEFYVLPRFVTHIDDQAIAADSGPDEQLDQSSPT
jgi:hypothetical protein